MTELSKKVMFSVVDLDPNEPLLWLNHLIYMESVQI